MLAEVGLSGEEVTVCKEPLPVQGCRLLVALSALSAI